MKLFHLEILQKNSESKQRKVADEYVKLCGYKQGGDRKSNCQNGVLKLSDIAKQLNTSKRNLQNERITICLRISFLQYILIQY